MPTRARPFRLITMAEQRQSAAIGPTAIALAYGLAAAVIL